jgi:hypothetical protein
MLIFELEYKKKQYYAHFNHYAISRTETELNASLSDVIETTEGTEALFYHAVVAGCKHMDVEPVEREDIAFLIDGNFVKVEYMLSESLKAIEDEKKELRMKAERILQKGKKSL